MWGNFKRRAEGGGGTRIKRDLSPSLPRSGGIEDAFFLGRMPAAFVQQGNEPCTGNRGTACTTYVYDQHKPWGHVFCLRRNPHQGTLDVILVGGGTFTFKFFYIEKTSLNSILMNCANFDIYLTIAFYKKNRQKRYYNFAFLFLPF